MPALDHLKKGITMTKQAIQSITLNKHTRAKHNENGVYHTSDPEHAPVLTSADIIYTGTLADIRTYHIALQHIAWVARAHAENYAVAITAKSEFTLTASGRVLVDGKQFYEPQVGYDRPVDTQLVANLDTVRRYLRKGTPANLLNK